MEETQGAPVPLFGGRSIRMTEIRLGGADRVPTHDHGAAHVLVVTAGALCERHAGRGASFGAGTVRYSPSGDRHVIGRTATLRCLLFEMTGAHVPATNERRYAQSPRLTRIAQRLAEGLHDPLRTSPLDVESSALELFASMTQSRVVADERRASWVDTVRDVLHARFTTPPSLAELQSIVNRDPAHIARAWRQHYGCTMSRYLLRLRIDAARTLLVRTETPLASVAVEAGFADQSHMTRAFQRNLGLTPRQVRLLNR
jgi:AraC-like DNA-binding protein